jgi:hypothetical protein
MDCRGNTWKLRGDQMVQQSLNAKWLTGDEILIAYLDLCGTKFFYSTFPLEQQIERIERFVSNAWAEFDNEFGEHQKLFYVHMYGDSIVAAEKQKDQIADCTKKFVNWLLRIQRQILYDSDADGVPTLSRGLIKRGKYFGILFDRFGTSIGDTSVNFSLVGGSTIVEMDKALEGLPMGVYIDNSTVSEFQANTRLVDVEGNHVRFVKPEAGFYDMHKIFGGEGIDAWVSRMVQASGNDIFVAKLRQWADAVQGRSDLIKRQRKEEHVRAE